MAVAAAPELPTFHPARLAAATDLAAIALRTFHHRPSFPARPLSCHRPYLTFPQHINYRIGVRRDLYRQSELVTDGVGRGEGLGPAVFGLIRPAVDNLGQSAPALDADDPVTLIRAEVGSHTPIWLVEQRRCPRTGRARTQVILAGEPHQRRVTEQLGASPRRSTQQAGSGGCLPGGAEAAPLPSATIKAMSPGVEPETIDCPMT